ncbi:hypothetical protein [Archangium sp.]|jgi:hypothetical protein|uniref:monooxygenase n=1 Tax=Archangium sp. TaxID=1872627 RepID=UPI002ED99D22
MRRLFTAGLLLTGMGLAACSEETDETAPNYHRDVAPLVQQKCGGCHVEGGIGPMPLQTYADVFKNRDAIRAAVESRTMPPWMPSNECNQYHGDSSLKDEQIQLLSRWVSEGGREGKASESPGVKAPPAGGLSRVDVRVSMKEPYTPKTGDDYRCFIMDWSVDQTAFITGFQAEPGVASIVHHVIAYLVPPAAVSIYQQLDNNEAGPGYTCFGGSGAGQAAFLGAWAPGTVGSDFPEGTGIKVAPGSKVVLQVHYSTTGHGEHSHGLTAAAEIPADTSALAFKVDSTVTKQAVVMAFLNPAWFQKKMNIPAGQTDVVHRYSSDVTKSVGFATGGLFKNNMPLTFHMVTPHMHKLGTRIRLDMTRADTSNQCLMEVPRWNFNHQNNYKLLQAQVINPGDTLNLECHWDNSAPGAVDSNWGETTSDEMCMSFLYITQ